jgi:hypothetical protein
MAAMDSQYVSGNAHHVVFLCNCRKDTDPFECDKLGIWNSCNSDDASKTE